MSTFSIAVILWEFGLEGNVRLERGDCEVRTSATPLQEHSG